LASYPTIPHKPNLIPGVQHKFSTWRKGQCEAVKECMVAFNSNHKRFVAQAQPTGSGKSLSYLSVALLTNCRTLILTNTKGLQDQIMSEFAGLVTDIRGRNSYKCKVSSRYNCAEGPCRYGYNCQHKEARSCNYLKAVDKSNWAHIVITNYAYWITIGKMQESPIGDFDLLVLDEAHESDAALMGFLTITITSSLLRRTLGESLPNSTSIHWWRTWAATIKSIAYERLNQEIDKNKGVGGEVIITQAIRDLESLISHAEAITEKVCLDWSIVFAPDKGGEGDCVNLFPVKLRYAEVEHHLFRGIENVILTSATLCFKTLRLLDIPQASLVYTEYPSHFPIKNRPIYVLPSVRLKYGQPQAELMCWLKQVDRIVDFRLDRKGIIHTHSFALRDFIYKNSRHRKLFYTNQTGNTASVVEAFKTAKAPAILLSPSMVSGWDFPYDQCRYQIVAKVPFPSLGDAMLAKRAEVDKDLTHYMTMLHLIQCCGRGVRSDDDTCETFIVDGNMKWWYGKYYPFAPKWFREAIIKCTGVPVPAKLADSNSTERLGGVL